MAKPSIFSKDYERIMRKRRKRFTIIAIIVVIAGGLIAVKAVNYDYSKLRDRLQKWVDGSSEAVENPNEVVDNSNEVNKPVELETESNKVLEQPKEEKEELLDVVINGAKISFKIEESNESNNPANNVSNTNENGTINNITNTTSNTANKVVNQANGVTTTQGTQEQGANNTPEQVVNNDKPKKFVEVREIPEGYTVEISPTGQKAEVLDNNQNLYVINIKGEVKDFTLAKYIAPNGEIFEKEAVRSIYKDYLWHTSPKMINDNQIAYISNIPYFGLDLNQYVSVVDIEKNTHIILWGAKAKNITFGSLTEKGLEVNLDGNIMYINNEGVLIS